MKSLNASLFFLLALLQVGAALAAPVENKSPAKKKLRVDVVGKFTEYEGGSQVKYSAGDDSTFYIYAHDDATATDIIKFSNVVEPACAKTNDAHKCPVANDKMFYTLNQAEVPIFYYRESLKFDHGILVVPFKFRTKDQSLSGQSTLGYYAGAKDTWLMGSGTYFGSVGLSQVDVPVDAKTTETRTGLTISAGYIFQSTDGFQVAFVVGSDRLGGAAGKTWDYEKDIWVSIGLGFNLAKQ